MFRRHRILGETLRSIAASMDCGFQRVQKVCAAVERWLSSQAVEPNIPAIRQKHEQIYRWLLGEAFAEWEKSKRTHRTTKARTVRGRVDKGGQLLPELVTTEYVEREACGDPRYLAVIDQLLKSERAMWGADEPKRHEHSGAAGGPITLAGVLSIIEARPPSPPATLDPSPPNVIDVEHYEALIRDPSFMPETLAKVAPAPSEERNEG